MKYRTHSHKKLNSKIYFRMLIQLTLANDTSATTVYSEKVDVPIEWYTVCPLQVNRLVPSGITHCCWVPLIFSQRFVLSAVQTRHSKHCGTYNGMTWSPGWNLVTPSPTLSTIPAPSCPKIIGKRTPRTKIPFKNEESVWQTPVATIFMRTSLALGGATSTSSITSGVLGAQATAALHLITCRLRLKIINNFALSYDKKNGILQNKGHIPTFEHNLWLNDQPFSLPITQAIRTFSQNWDG